MPPEHFSPDAWFEYALGATSPEQRELMENHLSAGCSECQAVVRNWTTSLDLRRREAAFEAPPSSVQLIKTSFRWREPWQWRSPSALLARLVFDSSRHAPPAPRRGAVALSRHLLHETDLFVIDLRVEEDTARRRVRLTGQILNAKEPSRQIAGAHVTLLCGDSLAAEASAGPSGEFDLEYHNEDGLELLVDVRGHNAIWITLPSQLGK